MHKQAGFTLIELVMVIIILGILSAVALPRFVDLSTDAVNAAKAGSEGAVKSAYAIAIAKKKGLPTVAELAAEVDAENVTAAAAGVQLDINGTTYTVQTYENTTCDDATDNTGTDLIACVGDITP